MFNSEEQEILDEVNKVYYEDWRLDIRKENDRLIANTDHTGIEKGLSGIIDTTYIVYLMSRLDIANATVTVKTDERGLREYRVVSVGEAYKILEGIGE